MKLFQNKFYFRIGAFLAIALLSGCNTTYEMEVDAITNPAVSDAESYVIVPRDPETDINDLRYKETVAYIKTALSGKGMYEALSAQDADMVVEVDYGMEPPRREFKVVEEPVFATIQQPDRIQTVSQRDPKTGRVITYTVRVPGARSRELIGYQERLISITKKGRSGAQEIADMMTALRNDPPKTLAGSPVIIAIDHGKATQTDLRTGATHSTELPASNVLQFITEAGDKVSARPSGTEPKIKFYFSVRTTTGGSHAATKAELERKIDTFIEELNL